MVKWEYPSGFVERMRSMLGEDLSAFLESLATPETGLRVNTLRSKVEAFESFSPFALAKLVYPTEGFVVSADARAGRHPYHAAGLYYLQDPGAMTVGALVDAQPGERVLDLSAAPGGKATQLAARMGNAGLLIANDVSRSRAVELGRNLERCGVTNAVVTADSVERLARHFGAFFDRVLVDAPCSGESMFHKSPAARTDWSAEIVLGCARRQGELIRTAGALVRPGGRLVYSTCTFSREENEEIIGRFLQERKDFAPDHLEHVAGAESVEAAALIGRDVAAAASAAMDRPTGRAAAYRLWPHRMPGAGHFVAALRRAEESSAGPTGGLQGHAVGAGGRLASGRGRGAALERPSREALRFYREFLNEAFPSRALETERVWARGATLFEPPEDTAFLGQLDVVRAGVELGSARAGRFEPAHAMAMALAPTSARDRVELTLEDPRVDRYLEGHPIEAEGRPGWVPVTVEGFALGWGKRVGTVVKNHYPKGLRRTG